MGYLRHELSPKHAPIPLHPVQQCKYPRRYFHVVICIPEDCYYIAIAVVWLLLSS